MELNIGDKVMYRKSGQLYEGIIKSIDSNKVEIDDSTVELIIVAVSKNTIADNLTFKQDNNERRKFLRAMAKGFVP